MSFIELEEDHFSPEDYYQNIDFRKSEKNPVGLDAIDEQDNENDLTVEHEKARFPFPENEESGGRKERAATFKPFNYNKESEKTVSKESPATVVNVLKAPNPVDSDKALLATIKERMDRVDDEESKSLGLEEDQE